MFSGVVRQSIAGAAFVLVLLAVFVCTSTTPVGTGSSSGADYLVLNFEAE